MIKYSKAIDPVTIARAIDKFGVNSQEDVAIEEMSELTKAIIKNRRYGTRETEENLLEEMADVYIMLIQLMFIHGFDELIVDRKIKRLKQWLNELEGEDNA